MEGERAGNYHVEILLCSNPLHSSLAFHVIILFTPHHNLHGWLPITFFSDEKTPHKKQKDVQYLTQSQTIYKCAETF